MLEVGGSSWEGEELVVTAANELGRVELSEIEALEVVEVTITLLATAMWLELGVELGVELGAGLDPLLLVSLLSERKFPLTMSERVFGPSSAEVWLWDVVGGAEAGVVPLSELEEVGSGGKCVVARSNLGCCLVC